MEKHVTNKQISEKLKSLGVKQESEFYWCHQINDTEKMIREWYLNFEDKFGDDHYSAFLASELGELLPPGYYVNKWKVGKDFELNKPFSEYKCTSPYSEVKGLEPGAVHMFAPNMPDAMGKMLIYLLENKLINL